MESKNDKILSAAFRLFHQHGFKKVTMSDIAEAAEMSRPTLYAAFPSKDAVFAALSAQHSERGDAETKARLPRAKSLEGRLSVIFEVWIIEPFASVIDSPNGLDMLANSQSYVPEGYADMYARFERHLLSVLTPAVTGKRAMTARDLAHIMTLATKGLKASSSSLGELRRLTEGLIAMAVVTATGRS